MWIRYIGSDFSVGVGSSHPPLSTGRDPHASAALPMSSETWSSSLWSSASTPPPHEGELYNATLTYVRRKSSDELRCNEAMEDIHIPRRWVYPKYSSMYFDCWRSAWGNRSPVDPEKLPGGKLTPEVEEQRIYVRFQHSMGQPTTWVPTPGDTEPRRPQSILLMSIFRRYRKNEKK